MPHLRALSSGTDSEILVLEAVPFTETLLEMTQALSDPGFAPGGDTDLAERYVAAVAALLRDEGLRVRELVQIGSPTATIAGVARRQKATLIALAVRERRGFPQSLFRTLAENVLRASPTPIYAIPAATTEPGVQPPRFSGDILIPVDGSGLSLHAIPPALEFARGWAGKLIFVHVESRGSVDKARQVLDAALRRSEQEGLRAETIMKQGDPAEEILKLCAELRPSLIAMRTRLSLNDANGPLGSVTVKVLRAAPAPMLIVRKPPRPETKAAFPGAPSTEGKPVRARK